MIMRGQCIKYNFVAKCDYSFSLFTVTEMCKSVFLVIKISKV